MHIKVWSNLKQQQKNEKQQRILAVNLFLLLFLFYSCWFFSILTWLSPLLVWIWQTLFNLNALGLFLARVEFHILKIWLIKNCWITWDELFNGIKFMCWLHYFQGKHRLGTHTTQLVLALNNEGLFFFKIKPLSSFKLLLWSWHALNK